MSQLKIFIELTRLTKPIGFMLLFWPCSWGLASAFKLDQNLYLFFIHLTFGPIAIKNKKIITTGIITEL